MLRRPSAEALELVSMAYQRGDYIAFGVREILLYGLLIGAVFFGFGWLARPEPGAVAAMTLPSPTSWRGR